MSAVDTAVGLVKSVFDPQTYGFLTPLAPGGIIVFGLLFFRPGLSEGLASYPHVFGSATPAVLACFFSYVIGACVLSLLSTFVEWVVGLVRKDVGIFNASGSAGLQAWRIVATEFLGPKLSPPLVGISKERFDEERAKIDALPDNVSDKLLQKLELARQPSKSTVDLDWQTWYSVIDDYFRIRRANEFSSEYIPALHASGWAASLVFTLATRRVHWALWLAAAICTFYGLALTALAAFLNPRLTDTTAQIASMLREIRSENRIAAPVNTVIDTHNDSSAKQGT